jgi:hypothetical protein
MLLHAVRAAELEATVQSLNTQMREQEEEANHVISQWQDSCTAAEEKCRESEKELEALKQAHLVSPSNVVDEKEFNHLKSKLDQKDEQLRQALQVVEDNKTLIQHYQGEPFEAEGFSTESNILHALLIVSATRSDQLADQAGLILVHQKQLEQREAETKALVSDLKLRLSSSEDQCRHLQNDLNSIVARKDEDLRVLRERVNGETLHHEEAEGMSRDFTVCELSVLQLAVLTH